MLWFSPGHRFRWPPYREQTMRNTILLMVMALLYAYGSEQDYQDATLVQAYAPALQAAALCRAAPSHCAVAPDGPLAWNP
jgi:hypothetical protein